VSEIQPSSSDDKFELFFNDSTHDQTEDFVFDDASFSLLDLHNADDFIDFNQNGRVTTMVPDSGNSSASADIWEGAHSTLDAPHSAHQPAASLPRAFSSSADAHQTAEGGSPGAFVPPAGCFGLPMTAMAGMGLPMDPVTFAAAQSRGKKRGGIGMPAMPQFHQGSGPQSIYQPMSHMTQMMMQFNLMMHQMMGMNSPMLHGGLNRPARQARLMPKQETHDAGGGVSQSGKGARDAGGISPSGQVRPIPAAMARRLEKTDAAGLNVTGRKHAAQGDLPKLIKRNRCA
jgi:hypothetical protein